MASNEPVTNVDSTRRATRRNSADPNIIIASLIGVAIVVLFFVVVLYAVGELKSVPMASRAETGVEAYDPFARAVQVVGLVTPVLTTIVGFYFGVRAGNSGREAAESRANRAESTTQTVVTDAATKYAGTQRALTSLEERLASNPQASSILQDVRNENPQAFTVDNWLKSLADLPKR